MQESWQMFLKPAMSTPHVDAAFQAGMHAPSPSTSGRVLYPFPMTWSDIGETDGSTVHGKHTSDRHVTTVNMAASSKQMPVEGHGNCKVSGSGLVDAVQGGPSIATNGVGCVTETKNGGQHMTTTHENLGMMAMAVDNSVKVHGHSAPAFSTSDLSSTRSSNSDNALDILSAMAQINHINQGVNEKNINTQSKSKNDVQINDTHMEGFVSNAKCKQKAVHHRHPTVQAVPRCQIDGCKQDLSKAKKEYHRRHKVCEMHSKASSVFKCGLYQRFCQQCSRFHVVGDFDDAKRSCRRRLEGHNRRRRKSISQGYANVMSLNQIQHQLMAATTMMKPLDQKALLNNQEKISYKIQNLENNTFPTSLDEKLLTLLSYTTKNASSFSSSPPLILNLGDNACALSLLSCNTFLDQPLTQSIVENSLKPIISSNLGTPSPFTLPNDSMVNLNANNSIVTQYPQPLPSMNLTNGKVETSSSIKSTKGISYIYPHTDYWKKLESLQNLELHHNTNLIDELLRQQQAYSNINSHI